MANPTPKQLAYLRTLAEQTGTTFSPPKTKTQASQAISQLKRRGRSTRSERQEDRRAISRGLAEDQPASAVADDEITGYGSKCTVACPAQLVMRTRDEHPPLHGDEAALYERYQDRLYRSVMSVISADHAIAEDACSFAWMQLLRRQPNRGTVFGWLRQVAMREAWTLRDRAKRKTPLVDADVDEHPVAHAANPLEVSVDPVEVITAREETRALGDLLAQVHPRGARYLALLGAGYSYNEIAALDHVTRTAVNRYLNEARAQLYELRAQGGESTSPGSS